MKFLALQLFVLATCMVSALGVNLFAHDFDDEWQAWKTTHEKTYDDEREETERRLIWQENLEFIVKHNLELQRGLHSYSLGMNAFGDMNQNEFNAYYNGLKAGSENVTGKAYLSPSNVNMPESVDWRKEGYVTPVKNQGHCGSCWAFSAVGALEGQTFRKTRKLVDLSEQNLVDCSKINKGCNGGWTTEAFEYVANNGGIDTEDAYPYKGEDNDCQFDPSNVGATCAGHVKVPRGDETALQEAVATIGPVSVSIDASHKSFRFYKSGVYDEPECSSIRLGHAVLAVGYDTTKDTLQKYWIVKNSWGTSWGMEGYVWMSRNNWNKCGIATRPSYPVV